MRKAVLAIGVVGVGLGLALYLARRSSAQSAREAERFAKSFPLAIEARHRGPGLCVWGHSPPTPAALDHALSSLEALGITSQQLRAMWPLFERWSDAAERRAHGRTYPDALLSLSARHAGIVRRVQLALAHRKIVALMTARMPPAQTASAEAAFAALDVHAQGALRDLAARFPRAFDVGGWVELSRRLRPVDTRLQLQTLAARVRAFAQAHHRMPAHLADLVDLPPSETRDAWHRPFLLETNAAGLTLRSLGQDGAPGGTGLDADIGVTVGDPSAAPPAPVPPAATPPHVDRCAARALEATVSRASVADLTQLGGTWTAHEVNGDQVGMALSGLQRGSVLARVGLCNGDVIHAINGVPLTGTFNELEAYAKAKGATLFHARGTRRGKPLRVTVHVR